MENNNENNIVKPKRWTRGVRKTNYEYKKFGMIDIGKNI